MLMLILIFLASFATSNGIQPMCIEKFKDNEPWISCQYPLPNMTLNQSSECSKSCEKEDYWECCNFKCIYGSQLGLLAEVNLKSDSFVKAFRYELLYVTNAVAEAAWSSVVKKSFETCVQRGKNVFDLKLSSIKTFVQRSISDIRRVQLPETFLCRCNFLVRRGRELSELSVIDDYRL